MIKKTTKKSSEDNKLKMPTKEVEVVKPKKVVKPVPVKPEPTLESEPPDVDNEDEHDDEPDDEELFEEIMLNDTYDLKCGGVFKKEEILTLELPKFLLDSSMKDMNQVSEKSNIIVTLLFNQTNPDLGKRIFTAIKNGFKEFKVIFPGLDEDEKSSVWSLTNPKVTGVDFGALMLLKRDEPRTVQVEISYEHLLIDNESIFE